MKTTHTTPKYIIDIMSRAKYETGCGEPGYTIKIRKATQRTLISTFEMEIKGLIAYAEKRWEQKLKANGWSPEEGKEPIAFILSMPKKTHYCNQYAVVTILDPIMMELEEWMQ